MTPPRHLWSGDWRHDSEAAAEELARRRGEAEQPTEALPREPAPPTRPPRPRPAAPAGLRSYRDSLARLGPRLEPRRPGFALVIVLGALILAGAAYAVSSLSSSPSSSSSSSNPSAPAAPTGRPWLGLQLGQPIGGGVFLGTVVPGGPADQAGLEPGDVITAVNHQSVSSPGDVLSLVAGMHPGDHVQVEVLRGAMTYTVDLTLGARPARYP